MKCSRPFVLLILAALFYATSGSEAEGKIKPSKVQPRGLGIGGGGKELANSGGSEGGNSGGGGFASLLNICKNESSVNSNPFLCMICKGPSGNCFKSGGGGSSGGSGGSGGSGSASSAASAASAASATS
ncbi:loricrin [Manduca sexta]|uniref:Uncharacterized protein n=1 Tax=Manduca sexta TaxID=7130 RepID=A0A921ZD13_MANSE|nr:loricrin [Manduca sexta]KAG6455126.1 hypothetical protein O3G_MSEX009028 [Manduca sexta]